MVKYAFDLPRIANIGDHEWRELCRIGDLASLAHVIIDPGQSSDLHHHMEMTEIYFIAAGTGVLTHGNKRFEASPHCFGVMPPGVKHRLQNTGKGRLCYLVFCVPAFRQSDVIMDEEEIPC